MTFDYQGAKKEGYSDDEILSYLSTSAPDFDVQGAIKEGYSPEEVSQYLTAQQKQPEKTERSALEKGVRVAGQFGLGAVEAATLPYDIAVAPLAIPGGQETIGDVFTRDILNDVYPTEEEGRAPRDTQFSTPHKELKEPIHISTRDLIEKATGLDLKPEGILEKAANWTGFIKDPKKIFELAKTGVTKGDLIKAIAPSGQEVLRGAGAGVALELAEKGHFGPIGTIAAAVMGDVSGNLASRGIKAAKNIIQNPRKVLAEVASLFTKSDKKDLQKQIIEDFKKSGIQADIGTLTNSDLVKFVQSRLAQSGLTGKALDDLKNSQLNQIKKEYKAVADSLGEAKHATEHEAGETLKESIQKIKELDHKEASNLYNEAKRDITQSSQVSGKDVADELKKVKDELKPGNLKASEEIATLDILEKIGRDVMDSEGNAIYASVKDLMNDKISLGQIINYEVQGGSKQLLKGVNSKLKKSIASHGKENPSFARKFIQAEKKFSQHAKEFRNKNISQLLNTHNPAQLMNRFDSVQGIRDVKKILDKTPEGKQIFKDLARFKLDETIGKVLSENVGEQVRLGSFSKLLDKGKNRDVIRELLPKESFQKLVNLQKNTAILSETAQKFLNASKSGVTLEDAGIVAKVLTDMTHLFTGNPWPLIKTGSTIAGARYLTRLIGDPNFLKLVEDSIQAAKQNDIPLMNRLAKQISKPVKAAIIETTRKNLEQ